MSGHWVSMRLRKRSRSHQVLDQHFHICRYASSLCDASCMLAIEAALHPDESTEAVAGIPCFACVPAPAVNAVHKRSGWSRAFGGRGFAPETTCACVGAK